MTLLGDGVEGVVFRLLLLRGSGAVSLSGSGAGRGRTAEQRQCA
ncbi:hypothetical protein ACF05T_33305 [Streptomyces lateritius]|uniref:Uncharacterized protein n=1 Tax=Streptomyces lateritius TaxID=67313 RepID=A0ABW6YLX5_9ACTN